MGDQHLPTCLMGFLAQGDIASPANCRKSILKWLNVRDTEAGLLAWRASNRPETQQSPSLCVFVILFKVRNMGGHPERKDAETEVGRLLLFPVSE